jgi:hypothetical protein
MNPVHRDAPDSAGLHLFQELSTVDEQLTRTLFALLGPRQNRAQQARRDRASPSAVRDPHIYPRTGEKVLER